VTEIPSRIIEKVKVEKSGKVRVSTDADLPAAKGHNVLVPLP
jgi:hypothetical protein